MALWLRCCYLVFLHREGREYIFHDSYVVRYCYILHSKLQMAPRNLKNKFKFDQA